MLLCEAAGFEVIIIETVGVGQSEVMIKNMVDFFLLLMLAGAGDELQGIKKGIMEVADGIAITKADGDNVHHATEAQAEYQHALHLNAPAPSLWQPKVLTVSALHGNGIEVIWKMIEDYVSHTTASGYFDQECAEVRTFTGCRNIFRIYFTTTCIASSFESERKDTGTTGLFRIPFSARSRTTACWIFITPMVRGNKS